MKKILSMALALTMVFALCAPAMAEDTTINSDNYTNGEVLQYADVELTVSASKNIQNLGGEVDSEKNDTQNRIWNVTISAHELHWDLVENVENHDQNWALKWDVSQHKYVKEYESSTEFHHDNIALAENETADKTFAITNNSNFDVSQETSISANPNLQQSPFEITSGSNSTIHTGTSANVTVTLKTDKLDAFRDILGNELSVDNYTAGNVRVQMEAGQIYTGDEYME